MEEEEDDDDEEDDMSKAETTVGSSRGKEYRLENRILEFQTRVKLRTSKYHFRWLPVYSYNTRTLFTTDVEYNLTYSLFSYTCLLLI